MTPEEIQVRVAEITERRQTREREYQRNWMRNSRAANPEKHREYSREYAADENNKQRKLALQKHSRHKRQYGLTLEQRNAMLLAQDNVCAGCSSPEAGGRHGWHMDHCHTTGKVRGLLCNGCNLALGHVKDNPHRLRELAAYVERHQ